MNTQKIMYVILGGGIDNMKLRADKVFQLHSNQPGTVITAGLPNEVKWMREYCSENNISSYPGHGSWDTLSNITRDILPNLRVLLPKPLASFEQIKITAPTGDAHGKRTMKAWDLFATKYHTVATLECPLSGESDGENEKKLLFLYGLGKPGILLLYAIARIMRK
jgi:hypothetical protein